jgi:hypothetical protein
MAALTMARRTKTFTQLPWTGGANTSVDPGVLNSNDLVIADNVVFGSSSARKKREGVDYFDAAIPAPTHRASSGTTRTLTFTDLNIASPADYRLVVGERITVASTGSGNDTSYAVTDGVVLSVTNTVGTTWTITYTASGSLAEGTTATTTLTVSRASSVIVLKDYWYLDGDSVKQQALLGGTDDFKLYSYTSSGRRTEVEGQPQTWTVVCGAAATLTTGDYFTFYSANDGVSYYAWYDIDAGGGDPAPGGKTAVPIEILSTDTAAQVATKTQLALDALSTYVATVDTATVTAVAASPGITTSPADVNTGFTIAVTETGATSPTTAVSKIVPLVFNNRAIFCFSGLGNKPIKYYPIDDAKYQLLVDAPDGSFAIEYLGRIWMNNKTNPDRMEYSSTGDHEEWGGVGDSGAIDTPVGDGDPRGITSAFKFKGILFLLKGTKVFRVRGEDPETFSVELVSDGIGSESQTAVVPVDESDVLFVSKRGFHSVVATDRYGDTEAAYVSRDIQPTFRDWNQASLQYIQGAYIPQLNSVAFAVPEDSASPDTLWLYNPSIQKQNGEAGVWYRWPNIGCTALAVRSASNITRLVTGTSDGRVIQAQNGDFSDYANTTGIVYRVKSGTIYPDGSPHTWKAFKKISFIFKPIGGFSFTVKVRVDNHNVQVLVFSQESIGARLGEDFVLGQSVLGVSNTLAPFTQQIDGYGRGITIEVTQTGTDEQVEIYGFVIEYEDADLAQETLGG